MKCYKCGYTLGENDYHCPRCGAIAIDVKEGLNIIIPLRWCRIVGVTCLISAITLYGICFGIMREVNIFYFGITIILSIIAIVSIARSYDSIAIMKNKNIHNKDKRGFEYCKHCYNQMQPIDMYCSMCGYKRKRL